MGRFTFGSVLGALAVALALAGCNSGSGSSGGVDVTGAARLLAGGGDGEGGGNGGDISLAAREGVFGGGASTVNVSLNNPPSPGADAFQASGTLASIDNGADDLDPDPLIVVIDRDIVVPVGSTLALEDDELAGPPQGQGEQGVEILSTQGSIFVLGEITTDDTDGDDGAAIGLVSLRGAVVVEGVIEAAGDSGTGGDGGTIAFETSDLFLLGTGTLDAAGANGTGAGAGGLVSLFPPFFNAGIQERNGTTRFGADTSVFVDGGAATAGQSGAGGQVKIEYITIIGEQTAIVLNGLVDASGEDGDGTNVTGGGGGSVSGSAGGPIVLAGTIDVSAGDGDDGGSGGDAGSILFNSDFPGRGPLFVLGDGAVAGAPTEVDLTGGSAPGTSASAGGDGGAFSLGANRGGIAWTGDIACQAGTSTDGPGAGGGSILIAAFRADIAITGDLMTFGADGVDSASNGGSGGDVLLQSLDGSIVVTGDTLAGGGDADPNTGDGSGGSGGDVVLLVDQVLDDLLTLFPATAVPNTNGRTVDLLDNLGGRIVYTGAIDASGGDSGPTDADGGKAGEVTLDADEDDGEDASNGGGLLTAGSTIDATGGDATGTGTDGDGGDVLLRASAKTGSSSSDGFDADPAAVSNNAGSGGGTTGTDGATTID